MIRNLFKMVLGKSTLQNIRMERTFSYKNTVPKNIQNSIFGKFFT